MTVNQTNPEIVTLGKYKIIRELGRGAMGIVYEGFDPLLERRVALKTIRKDLLESSSDADNVLQRFRREAQAAARLQHPNIILIYDYAEENDSVFIAMELVQGKELKNYFAQKHRFEIKAALEIMRQLLDGLGYSHKNNIVHRDIKPANIILINDSKQVKIADFGIAHIDTSDLTQVGEVMGTPSYMSPEQLLGKSVDGRADLYSAGVVLFELLTGEKPFTGRNITAVMQNVLTAAPPVPSQRNAQLSPLCDAIISKALSKDAADRYQTADEFKAALKSLLVQSAPKLVAPADKPKPPPSLQKVETAPPPKKSNTPATLEEWVEYLTKQEMPIFSHTARRINEAVGSATSNAMELGRIIQQDPTLTAKLLKLGNSAYYNPSRQKLPNIGRAIIILGIKNIHNLALACSYVESVISGSSAEQVSRQIAHSLHSAVQAKSFATLVNDPFPEEIFVASLMNNFGRVAFWCYGKEACADIRQRINEGMDAESAEISVLGFTLDELNAALCKAWQLGGLIEESIVVTAGDNCNKRVKLVHIGHELVRELANGLDSPGAQACLEQIAQLTQKDTGALLAIVMENAEQAVLVASQFGANAVTPYIIKPALLSAPPDEIPADAATVTPSTQSAAINQQERTRISQEIANMLNGPVDINNLLDKVMEGLQKSIYMDRVMFALITPNRAALREKFSKGLDGETRTNVLEFDISSEKNIFTYALTQNGASWITPRDDVAMQKLFTTSVRNQLGQHECFIMPIAMNNRFIGIFYCDRTNKKRPLERQALNVFVEFMQQANAGLSSSKK